MNGATAEDWVKSTRNPSKSKTVIIGNSHHFFRTFMKSQSSLNISVFPILFLFDFTQSFSGTRTIGTCRRTFSLFWGHVTSTCPQNNMYMSPKQQVHVPRSIIIR
jgi:hypothetical protein